jgi:hypothetical protein
MEYSSLEKLLANILVIFVEWCIFEHYYETRRRGQVDIDVDKNFSSSLKVSKPYSCKVMGGKK